MLLKKQEGNNIFVLKAFLLPNHIVLVGCGIGGGGGGGGQRHQGAGTQRGRPAIGLHLRSEDLHAPPAGHQAYAQSRIQTAPGR